MIAINDIEKHQGAEMATIILCCRVFFKSATIAELNSFVSDNDPEWKEFIRLTRIHKIRPVVYKIINQAVIPAKVKSHINIELLEVTKLNLKQALETRRLINLLRYNNIETIPYKGTGFSLQFFGDLISREASDIDLVINPKDLSRAIKVLKEDDYIPEHDVVYKYLGEKYISFFKDYTLNKYIGHSREFHIELHWGIVNNYYGVNSKANELFLEVKSEITYLKESAKILNPIAHFSGILIHHSVSDTFKHLKNIVDLSQAIRHSEVQRAGEMLNVKFLNLNLHKSLLLSNTISKELMGISLPQVDVLEAGNSVADHFKSQVSSRRVVHYKGKNGLLWVKNRALLEESILMKGKIYWLFAQYRFIPTQADFKVIKLPRSLFFLYYCIKPFRDLLNIVKS